MSRPDRFVEADRPRVNILSACRIAGVSRATLYRWMAAGKVEYIRNAGGQVRIYTDSLWRRDPDAAF